MTHGLRDVEALPLLADMLGLVLCLCSAACWVLLLWVALT